MKTRTMLAFVAPSLAMMVVFIALPLVSVSWQSFHNTQGIFREVTVESCSPGFLRQICTKEVRSEAVTDAQGHPLTQTVFIGWESYRLLLQPAELRRALGEGWSGLSRILEIDFYRALRFTLTFALITLPFVIGLGLAIALMVDSMARAVRGPLIFVSLLPYIITPVIGALSIRWLFVGDGILTAAVSALVGQKVYLLAQGWSLELLMLFYRVWHVAPFAFIVFYAGLQTVDQDTLESAVIDGASRLERLRYVILPHLAPLIIFVALIHLMDFVPRLRRDHRLLEPGAPHLAAMAHLLVSCPRPDRESCHLPRLGVGDADYHRRRVPADAAADAVLARPSARVLIVSARYLRQPLGLKFVSGLGLALWTLVAIFPLLWIATMSFRMPLDAFSSNPVQVLIGPHTKETNGGPSTIGVLVGGLALWLTYAAGRALLRSRRRDGAPTPLDDLAPRGHGIRSGRPHSLRPPPALRRANPRSRTCRHPGARRPRRSSRRDHAQHYRSVWIDHAFYRQFLNSMIVTGGRGARVRDASGRLRATPSPARARSSRSGS